VARGEQIGPGKSRIGATRWSMALNPGPKGTDGAPTDWQFPQQGFQRHLQCGREKEHSVGVWDGSEGLRANNQVVNPRRSIRSSINRHNRGKNPRKEGTPRLGFSFSVERNWPHKTDRDTPDWGRSKPELGTTLIVQGNKRGGCGATTGPSC